MLLALRTARTIFIIPTEACEAVEQLFNPPALAVHLLRPYGYEYKVY